MKTLILAATFASVALSFSAPMQAATQTTSIGIQQMDGGSFDRRGRGGHGCDTPRDIAEHPRCTKP